jgi:hypothetical protein
MHRRRRAALPACCPRYSLHARAGEEEGGALELGPWRGVARRPGIHRRRGVACWDDVTLVPLLGAVQATARHRCCESQAARAGPEHNITVALFSMHHIRVDATAGRVARERHARSRKRLTEDEASSGSQRLAATIMFRLRRRRALVLLLAAACLLPGLQTDTVSASPAAGFEDASQPNIKALLRQAPGLRGHTKKGGPLDLFRWHSRYAARVARSSWIRQ